MSTSCGWEGKGWYGSFRLRMNVWVWRQNCDITREHVPYLSACVAVIHYEEVLYQMYGPLPLRSSAEVRYLNWFSASCDGGLVHRRQTVFVAVVEMRSALHQRYQHRLRLS